MRRVRAITSGPSWSGSAARLARPTPCSPVMVPPRRDGGLHHLVERRPGARVRVGVRGVVDDDRVGVAVAGVSHDRDLDVVLRRDGRDRVEQVGQQRHRRADVLEQQRAARSSAGNDIRRARTNISPSSASSVTNTSAPCVSQAARITSTSWLRDAPGASDWATSSAPAERSSPIGLEVLDGVDRRTIHQLQHRGPHRRPHGDHGVGGRAHGRERRHQRRPRGLRRHQPQDRPRDDAERALAAHEQLEQRQPRHVLDPLAAEGDEGAVGEHDVEAEHVVGGDAVLHAAQAAGVGGHVAADRADLERRRVGRVPQAVLGSGRLDLGVEGARLDDRDLAGGVDLDRAHPLEAEHDPAVDGVGPAREPAAGASRDDADPVLGGPAHGGLHLGGVHRSDHRQRLAGRLVARPVVPVLLHRVGIGDHHVSGQRGDQLLHRFHDPMQPRVPTRTERTALDLK